MTMTINEARKQLDAIPRNPNAELANQDYVDEGRRLSGKKNAAAHGRLEEALATVMLQGQDVEVMVAADSLMAMPVRESVLRQIATSLPSLHIGLRDAAMRVLAVHRMALPKDLFTDLETLLMAHPHEFLRLALVVVPDADDPQRDVLWQTLLQLAEASNNVDELVLVARSAAAANRVGDLLFTLKKKPPALVREVARLSQQEASILGPLQIETSEVALAREIPACTDPAQLVALVKEALAVGCVNQLPRWLKPKDAALLQQAAQLAGPDEKPWLLAVIPRP